MLKADAYGHGLIRVADATADSADLYGVATVAEGAALRRNGVTKPVLATSFAEREIATAAELDLTLSVGSLAELNQLCLVNKNGLKTPVQAHLKLNTGMNRFGLDPSEIDRALTLAKMSKIEVQGCYSHLGCRDSAQLELFDQMKSKVLDVYPNALPHLCSSSTLDLNRYPLVRVGLAAYENAMSVCSEVMLSRWLNNGQRLGYGEKTLEHDCFVAWVFGGYADGINREGQKRVLIRGQICKVLAVCMDATAVETPFEAVEGETVELQSSELSADGLATDADTIPYTVITSWRGRNQRIYYD